MSLKGPVDLFAGMHVVDRGVFWHSIYHVVIDLFLVVLLVLGFRLSSAFGGGISSDDLRKLTWCNLGGRPIWVA